MTTARRNALYRTLRTLTPRTLTPMLRPGNVHIMIAWGAGLAALALYTATAAPGIVELFDDTLEFQIVGPTLGIAHPTGYPLYILLSGLWSRILFPFGEWAWRMNLFSALAGALTVGYTAHLAMRLDGAHLAMRLVASPPAPRVGAGLAAAVVFGLGPVWWSQTTVAEVYALHLFFVALILNRTLAVAAPNSDERSSHLAPPIVRQVTWLCLAIGLGLAHHRMTVLVLPGVALVLLWQRPYLARPSRAWAQWVSALLAPLLLYLWIPARAAMGMRDLNNSYENTWQGFWDHVLARRYGAFFSENPLMVERSPNDWFDLFTSQLGWLAIGLALVGLLQPLLRRRLHPGWWLVVLNLIATLLFALNYRVGDVEVFLLSAFLAIALLAAMGVAAIANLWTSTTGQQSANSAKLSWASGGLVGLLLVGLMLGTGGRARFATRAQDWQAHTAAYLMATVDFPPQSRVIGLEGEISGLRYMQLAHGLGRNAQGIVANLPADRRAAIEQAQAADAPVFITREVEGIAGRYSFQGAGPLVRVHPRALPSPLPPLAHTLDYRLEGAPLILEAAAWRARPVPGGSQLELTLDWRLLEQDQQNYKLSIRLLRAEADEFQPLLDNAGAPIVEDVFPLRQVAFTADWPTGQTIRDVHLLPLPASRPGVIPEIPGGIHLQMIIYNAETIAEVGRWQTPLELAQGPIFDLETASTLYHNQD